MKKYRKIIPLFYYFLLSSLTLTFNSAQAQDTLMLKGLVEIDALNSKKEKVSFFELIEAAQREGLSDAEKHFRKARNYNVVGAVFGYPGAFLIGFSLRFNVFTIQIRNPEMFVTGLSLWGFNIILAATVRDPQLRKGARIYNEAMHRKRLNIPTEENL